MKIFYDWKKVFDICKTSFSSARNEYNLHEVEKNKNSSTGVILIDSNVTYNFNKFKKICKDLTIPLTVSLTCWAIAKGYSSPALNSPIISSETSNEVIDEVVKQVAENLKESHDSSSDQVDKPEADQNKPGFLKKYGYTILKVSGCIIVIAGAVAIFLNCDRQIAGEVIVEATTDFLKFLKSTLGIPKDPTPPASS